MKSDLKYLKPGRNPDILEIRRDIPGTWPENIETYLKSLKSGLKSMKTSVQAQKEVIGPLGISSTTIKLLFTLSNYCFTFVTKTSMVLPKRFFFNPEMFPDFMRLKTYNHVMLVQP